MSGVVRGQIAEADNAHLGGSHDLPTGHSPQAGFDKLSQNETALDSRAKRRQSKNFDRHPKFQRAEVASELNSVVGEIELLRMLLRVLEIFRQDSARVAKLVPITHQHASDIIGLE